MLGLGFSIGENRDSEAFKSCLLLCLAFGEVRQVCSFGDLLILRRPTPVDKAMVLLVDSKVFPDWWHLRNNNHCL